MKIIIGFLLFILFIVYTSINIYKTKNLAFSLGNKNIFRVVEINNPKRIK